MPFKKGHSGNPRGRPKKDFELADIARSNAPEAMERAVFWMRSDNAKASIEAVKILLERGYGKAPAEFTVNHKNDLSDLSAGQREALIELVERELEERAKQAAGVSEQGQAKPVSSLH